MIKTLVLSLLFAASSAMAVENWVSVQDAANGDRLLVDSETFSPTKGDDGTVFIAAAFRFVSDGELSTPFAYVTEASTCIKSGGLLYYRTRENGQWVTKGRYWWAKNGSKMYDAGGQALCDILRVRIKENAEDKPKQPERKMY